MGSWAHSWCPRFVRSVRLLYSPRRFTYFRFSFPSIPSLLWALSSHRHRWLTPYSTTPSVFTGAVSNALQHVLCWADAAPPFNFHYQSRGVMLSTLVLVVQRYFLAMGVGSAPTPPMARTLRRSLESPNRCTAPPPGWDETALQRPLQVPWGRTSCLAPCSPVLLPHCGCWACIDPASGSCSLSRPQRTWVLLSDALQRVLRQAGGRPPFHVLYKSPGALLRALFLIPQRYFLDVDAGPVSASPVARSLYCTLAHTGVL
ncbi:hypothetical protein NDU88_006322 [Pleurodeles waltl]|uniref:Uncharacterized protein n=1 Tax=Pleurodeles waltl TaxID=8319 RepID=A0AAV7NTT1_PLEWA|nr:hypothetical protein NDU88_006322 [Pleurodeles waltl]